MRSHLSFLCRRNRPIRFLAILLGLALLPAAGASAQSVAAGGEQTAVVQSDGALWIWGDNSDGQQGVTGGDRLVPARLGSADNWAQVSAGSGHFAAVRLDGTLWTWGRNLEGQLGRNNFVSSSTPAQVGVERNWVAVAAGGNHTLAVKSDGSLWAFGKNDHGQLGNGTQGNRSTPVRVGTDSDWRTVAAGDAHSLAIRTDGTLWAWGSNLDGQVGNGSTALTLLNPVKIGTATWAQIAAGNSHTLALRTDGTLWAWGRALEGQLGIGASLGMQRAPVRVGSAANWTNIAAGNFHSAGLRSDGTLWGWGMNFSGQLGDGSSMDQRNPVRIGDRTNWTHLAAGANHLAALDSDGVLWASGLNASGQLGTGNTETVRTIAPSFYGLPDLVLTGFATAGEILPGVSVPLNIFGENSGSGAVKGDQTFTVELVLSPVAEWGYPEAISLGSFSATQFIGSGDGFLLTRLVTFPSSLPSGTYYIGGRINGNGNVDESGGENNIYWQSAATEFLADLMIGEITAPAENYGRGEQVFLTVPVRNEGLGAVPAGAPVTLEVRLTKGALWGENDDIRFSNTVTVSDGWDAGEVRTVDFSGMIPEAAPLGSFYVAAQVSLGGNLEEETADNNTGWSAAASVQISGPGVESALDFEGPWTTGGDALWFGREDFDAVGGSAAQTPPLSAGQHAYVQTSVEGPVVVSFNWKALTQRAENYLSFSVDGVEVARISGDSPWQERSFLVSAGINQLRWTYHQGEASATDAAWLDNVSTAPVTQPDLLVTELQYEPGERVLQKDRLTLTAVGRNQGSDARLPENFQMEVRLSKNRIWGDGDDVALGFMNRLQDLDADNRFVYLASLALPDSIPAGDYYVGVFADSTDLIGEFEEGNNVGWSANPDLKIVRRPDLQVTDLIYENGYYVVYPSGTATNEMQVSFTVRNNGLADVAGAFRVQVLLTPDREIGNGNDSVLLDFAERAGLPAGQTRKFQTTIEIPEGVRTGEMQYLLAVADPDGSVAQSNVGNDFAISDDADIFISEYPLDVAVDNLGTEFRFVGVPWFGQSVESFDAHSSAKSGRIENYGTSAFETVVNLEQASLVSFYWKVSSQNDEEGMDWVSFSIDGVVQASLAGEADWRRETFPLPAGESILRWSYQKDYLHAEGADAAWVDRITYHVPDLVVEKLDFAEGDYESGQTFPATVTIRNQGNAAIGPNPQFQVQLRLSQDMFWGTEDDVILATVPVAGLAMDSSRELTMDIRIPENVTFAGDYFVAAKVDATNIVVESNELNNVRFSPGADVYVTPAVTLAEAMDDARYPLPDQWIVGEWTSGGAAPWYGVLHRALLDGSGSSADQEDSARSGEIPSGTSSWVERRIEVSPTGPAEVVFRWKVSSLPSANSLRFSISDQEQARISGDVDWKEERFLIPAGPQVLRWTYVKTNSQVIGEDAGFLDDVRIQPVTLPDLAIVDVQHSTGAHVLERDNLTLQAVTQNRGTDLAGVTWDTADLEVRLSIDDRWGNGDDVVLMNLGDVYFDSADNLIFSGDFRIPLDTPGGTYRLALLLNPHEKVAEYDHDNNYFWSELGDSVTIERRPNLELTSVLYDEAKRYHPLSELQVDWTIANVGLGDVAGGLSLGQKLELRARDTREELKEGFSWVSDSIFVKDLTNFSQSKFMPGVSAQKPEGHTENYQGILTLPDELELLKALEIVEAEATRSMVGDGHREKLEFYEFSLVMVIDSGFAVEESDEANVYGPSGIGRFRILPVYESWPLTNFADWVSENGIGIPDEGSAEYAALLLRYALDLNTDAGGESAPRPGFTTVDGQEYLRLAFSMVKGALDLRYVVESSTDLANWTPLVTLEPPYVWNHGPQSLNGVGGLTSDPLVVTAADFEYTARVTVRDGVSTADAGESRFLRLKVELIEE